MNHFFSHITSRLFPAFLTGLLFAGGYRTGAQMENRIAIRPDTAAVNQQLTNAKHIYLSGNKDSAIYLFTRALAQSRYSLYDYGIVRSLMGLGNIQVNSGNYAGALAYYRSALTFCNTDGTKKEIASLYNNMGVAYGYQGRSEKSMAHYEKALQYAEKYGTSTPMETLYGNIAIPLERLGESKKSLYYLAKGEPLAKKNHSYMTLANIYLNQGTSYFSLKSWEKSRRYFQAALLTATKHHFPDIRFSASLNLGLVALNTGHPEAALTEFKNTDTIKGNISAYNQNKKSIFLARAYLELNKLQLAENCLLKALPISKRLNTLKETVEIHGMLSDLYAATGSYKNAYEQLSLEKALNDSMNEKKALDAVARMEIKYRSVLKDQEIARKQLTIDQQQSGIINRNIWIVSITACLLLLFGFFFLQRRSYRRKQKLKNEQLINVERQQEIKVMKAIMSGEEQERIRLAREIHDGIMVQFSVLKMNLSALVGREKIFVAKETLRPLLEQLDEATNNLRRTAHNLMPDMLLEEGLPEALYYFCNNLKKSTPLEIVFHVLGNIPRFDVQFELSVYRIIQELVQNVIKHAEATQLIVQLSYENNLLSLTVEDNGKGMQQNDPDAVNGLGMKSIHARVTGLNGRIETDSQPGTGTSARLEFDMKS
ncbi:MAG TPA: ATP-binding protein [Edaphocola sp.]|nr:ATP-binding protein [Edaphocola sp.]